MLSFFPAKGHGHAQVLLVISLSEMVNILPDGNNFTDAVPTFVQGLASAVMVWLG